MTWDRAVPSAIAVLLPAGLTLALLGRPAGGLIELLVVGVVVVALTRRSRQRRPDVDWTAAPVMPTTATVPRRGSASLALAPVEMRELLLSPWFGAGVGICVLLGSVFVISADRSWWAEAAMMPLAIHPLCGLTIIAVHHNVTRARRDQVEELFESCPVDTGRRMGGHLVAGFLPVAVASIWLTATLGTAGGLLGNLYGPIDERVIVDLVTAAVLLPMGATALGVLLGRRLPFALAPGLAVVAIAVLLLPMAARGPDGYGLLATAAIFEGSDPVFFELPAIGRLLWIAGLVALVAGLALAAMLRPQPLAVIGALVAVVGIVLIVRPPADATVERLAGYATGTGADSECHQLSDGVELCAIAPYRDFGDTLADALEPVATAMPDRGFDPPITMGFVASDPDRLPDRVRQQIQPVAAPAMGLPFHSSDKALTQARFALAATALDVPVGGDPSDNYLVDGQARGVILIWLGTAGLPIEETMRILKPYSTANPTDAGNVWPSLEGCRSDVQWAPQDVAAARSLVALDRATVGTVVDEHWERWLDPATPTDDLLVAVGLPAQGPAARIHPVGSSCE